MVAAVSDEAMNWLEPLVRAFDLGEPNGVERLRTGLIQQTWRLTSVRGVFICQKLHPDFDRGVTEDAQAISTYLAARGFCVPRFIFTGTGDLHLSRDSQLWRVMTCLPGITHASAPSPAHLEEAGYAAGRLHGLLADFEHRFRFQLPHFHDSAHIWWQLSACPSDPAVAPEQQFVLATLPELFLPAGLPGQIIHGDLKITNFLFDGDGRVVGLVDLDTFMVHSLYVELGDALRSWCTRGERFDLDAFACALRGYARSGTHVCLEPALLVRGLKLITLELGARYLKDYYEDRYFGWDPALFPSRRAHNLARTRRQIAVYRDIVAREVELAAIVETACALPVG
jgi:hypothetical protein